MLINIVWYWYKKQTLRTKERNRDLRNKHRHIWPTNLNSCQESKMGKERIIQQMVLGKLDNHM